MAKDYTKSLNLPSTSFPMRASLPQREPDTLRYWEEMDLYNQMQAAITIWLWIFNIILNLY